VWLILGLLGSIKVAYAGYKDGVDITFGVVFDVLFSTILGPIVILRVYDLNVETLLNHVIIKGKIDKQ
jgi:hypothetical protein